MLQKMSKKDQRLQTIQDIIARNSIATQGELVDHLRQEGYDVTQATVSRDITELRLVRVPIGRGRHRYALSNSSHDRYGEFRQHLRLLVREIDRGENIVVVHTQEAQARGLSRNIDLLRRDDIVGTVAGLDTVLVVVRTVAEAEALADEWHDLMMD